MITKTDWGRSKTAKHWHEPVPLAPAIRTNARTGGCGGFESQGGDCEGWVDGFVVEKEVVCWGRGSKNLGDSYTVVDEDSYSLGWSSLRLVSFCKWIVSYLLLFHRYTKEEVCDQFKLLLTQYNTRKFKPWIPPPVGRQTHNPVGEPYLEKLQKVLQLRREMSLSWTTGKSQYVFSYWCYLLEFTFLFIIKSV